MTDNKDTPRQSPVAQQGTSEETLRAARIAKADKIRARGEDPFTNDIDPGAITDLGALRAHYAAALAEGGRYEAERVQALNGTSCFPVPLTVVGRVVASRSFGKAAFLRLRDRAGEIQLFCKKDRLGDSYERLDELDVADHVQATGLPMVTKTGELSIEVASLRLLTKAYLPPPEKWHGLTDVEVRYRRRYVDLMSNPDVLALFKARAVIVRALRDYLDRDGFIEVETPTMTTLVGGATARPFITHHNALDMDLYMRVAPELYLKRLVVGGLDRVYELGRQYRNEGISTRHNPEFTMLEFYRAYSTYETLMEMTEQMLRHVDGEVLRQMPTEHAKWLEARPFCLDQPFIRKTMLELLEMRMGSEVEQLLGDQGGGLMGALRAAGLNKSALRNTELLQGVFERRGVDKAVGIDFATRKQLAVCESHGERVFLLYELLVEPNLAKLFRHGQKSVPVFVTDHPVDTSPLARRQTRPGGDSSLVDRFELFVQGKELCNAFSELNDPVDQAARFRQQVAKKARGAEETMDYDEDYIRALEHGLPPTAGFGMGIDRLTMMLTAQESIREVILFPLLRPER